MKFQKTALLGAISVLTVSSLAFAMSDKNVGDDVIAAQRAALAESSKGAGFGPQAPRDIDNLEGENDRIFAEAPDYDEMNLCNIHFHKGAEHKGGEFTKYAGNGDGAGKDTGYLYSGELSEAETAPVDYKIGAGKYGLKPGDTIEVHYVHTTAQVQPGPTLGSCLSESIGNPQLRVEGVVMVIVNDDAAEDFVELAEVSEEDGYYQAINMPDGETIEYFGSTTGPSYNEKGSPLQVSWSVNPDIVKISASSLAKWLEGNEFDETDAHGVRNLVENPLLLSRGAE